MKIQKRPYEIQIRHDENRPNATVFLNDPVLDQQGQAGVKHVAAHVYNKDGYSNWISLPHRGAVGAGHVFSGDVLRGELDLAGKNGEVQLVMSVEQGETRQESKIGPAFKVSDFLLGRQERTAAPAKQKKLPDPLLEGVVAIAIDAFQKK